jgi:hypothetical protein
MTRPVLSLNDGPQSVDGIQMLSSDEFRNRVQVCVVSSIGPLIFQELKEAMRSMSAGHLLLNCIGGAIMVLRSL